jgi:DNA-binding MarR family transcriptional regulator
VDDVSLVALDEALVRIRVAAQRPAYRTQLLQQLDQPGTLAELRLLRAVQRRSKGKTRPTIRDVAADLGIEQSTASRSVARAVTHGYLSKQASPDDQRECLLTLTHAGRRYLTQVTARRRALLARSVAEWSAEDLDRLVVLMNRLTDDIEGTRDGAR